MCITFCQIIIQETVKTTIRVETYQKWFNQAYFLDIIKSYLEFCGFNSMSDSFVDAILMLHVLI